MFRRPPSEPLPASGHYADSQRNGSSELDPGLRIPAQEIELQAGHLEIEGPTNRFSLSDGVELTAHRYRVTADHLTLQRTPQGIVVDGDGQVAFCPCASAPFKIGFSNATVAPPTDLLLRNTTFRACGVPVFWLPAYWIRSPNKRGLLTPSLAWRAADGPWIGTGIHVPLTMRQDRGGGVESLELLTGAYLLGGIDLGVAMRTNRTKTAVRWDFYERGLVAVDARGYEDIDKNATLSWQIDGLRGTRGKTGPVTFEVASRRYDRLRGEYSAVVGPGVYSFGVQGDIARATPFTDAGRFGPVARWGIRATLGSFGRIDSMLSVLGRFSRSETASATTIHSSELGFDARPGPLVVRTTLNERWLVGGGGQNAIRGGLLGVEQRVGLPLVANFGQSQRKLVHWLEPIVVGTVAMQSDTATYSRALHHPVATAQFGLVNKLGHPSGSTAASLQLRAGTIAVRAQQTRAVAGRWLASGHWLSLGGEAGWSQENAWLSNLRMRLGRVDRVAVRARLEGRGSMEPSHIRWLLDDGWNPLFVGWFSRPGWVAGTDLDLAVLHQVALTAGAAYDVGQVAIVSENLGAAYRHPCGCLAVNALAGWRVGRGGWDILVALDLMP